VYELLPQGRARRPPRPAGLVSTAPITSPRAIAARSGTRSTRSASRPGSCAAGAPIPPSASRPSCSRPTSISSSTIPRAAADALHPRDLASEVRARAVEGKDIDRAVLAPFIDFSVDFPGDDLPWRAELLDRALAPDLTYQRGGRCCARPTIRRSSPPTTAGSTWWGTRSCASRGRRPSATCGRRSGRRYGNVVDAYAAFLGRRRRARAVPAAGRDPPRGLRLRDGAAAALAARLGDADGRSLGERDARRRPDGVILAMGDGIRPGRCCGRLRSRHRAHDPLPDGPARRAGHGGADPHRCSCRTTSCARTR
jgi:hypothetical protein